MNRIFHPNIDDISGSVCLDVINQTWTPMFDLFNVFEVFLPQLLRYPNPADPLNGTAAALLLRNEPKYKAKVLEYIKLYSYSSLVSSSRELEMSKQKESSTTDTSMIAIDFCFPVTSNG